MNGYIEKKPHPVEALKSLLSGGLRIFHQQREDQ